MSYENNKGTDQPAHLSCTWSKSPKAGFFHDVAHLIDVLVEISNVLFYYKSHWLNYLKYNLYKNKVASQGLKAVDIKLQD